MSIRHLLRNSLLTTQLELPALRLKSTIRLDVDAANCLIRERGLAPPFPLTKLTMSNIDKVSAALSEVDF